MLFMITWSVKDPKKSINKFLQSGHGQKSGVKVINSVHVVGTDKDIYFVETDSPAIVHASMLEWIDALSGTVEMVLNDEQVKSALTEAAKKLGSAVSHNDAILRDSD